MAKKMVLDADGLSSVLRSKLHYLEVPYWETLSLQFACTDDLRISLKDITNVIRDFYRQKGFDVSPFTYEELSSHGRMLFFDLRKAETRYKGILEYISGTVHPSVNILVYDGSELPPCLSGLFALPRTAAAWGEYLLKHVSFSSLISGLPLGAFGIQFRNGSTWESECSAIAIFLDENIAMVKDGTVHFEGNWREVAMKLLPLCNVKVSERSI